jgi:HAD superfamily hydrolase (TIGR01549 family)
MMQPQLILLLTAATMLLSSFCTRQAVAFQQNCCFSSKNKRLLSTALAAAPSSLPLDLRGIIFDMDGTLVCPVIDFGEMRRRIYSVGSRDFNTTINSGCVLELTERLSPRAQQEATRILQEIEQDAIDRMAFMDGMMDLCRWLDECNLKRAVLTRNVERSVDALHDKLQLAPFDPAVARNTIHPHLQTNIAPKPHPDAIHYICERWNCSPEQVIMVGDSLKDDVVAASRAGCASVFLDNGKDNCSGNEEDSRPEERQPTLAVSSLSELHDILIAQYQDPHVCQESQV